MTDLDKNSMTALSTQFLVKDAQAAPLSSVNWYEAYSCTSSNGLYALCDGPNNQSSSKMVTHVWGQAHQN